MEAASVSDIRGPHQCCSRCSARLQYARVVADQIGLRDWVVQVAHDPPADVTHHATAQIAPARKLILLRFAEGDELLTPEEQRHVFVHELAHALVNDLWETVRVGIVGELGGTALRVYLSQVEREVERLVDVVATGLAERVPLPG